VCHFLEIDSSKHSLKLTKQISVSRSKSRDSKMLSTLVGKRALDRSRNEDSAEPVDKEQ